MGLLDDAIREHLELKRRRGADPDEVARQENEALGVPQEGDDGAAAVDEPAPVADAPAPEPTDEHWLVEETEPALAEPAVAEPEEEPVEAEPPAPPRVDEDVLEETPEFLQETPEHDRLWFEQKPPRDFDFDS